MEFRQLLAIGTGIGIEIRDRDLEATIARVRAGRVGVLGRTSIRRFTERAAAEWGAEYAAFLKKHGASHLAATVLLPRREVIVRQVSLPGVAARDIPSAITFQLDTLHPYGEEAVATGWSNLGGGAMLVGIVRQSAMQDYVTRFAEAGVATASFTFSAAAAHAAIRLIGPAPKGGLVAYTEAGSALEIYGESPAKPVFSAEFELPLDRAAGLAAAELRLAPDTAARPLADFLPAPRVNPVENDLSRDALAYAAALAGCCPWLASAANLLPAEQRSSNSRALLVPTAVLAALLLAAGAALVGWSSYEERQYLAKLRAEMKQLEPLARKSAALDREIEKTRARVRLLDEFRGRSRADLDVLNELTRLLPPPIWANQVELTRDSANISGEADQAAALLKVIDASPCFENSDFSNLARTGSAELFRITIKREGCK